ncbi:hypothetical protein [Sinorhizobium medicae]|nr:hypothetical protein [Sinorhizobium medicae]
MTPGYRPPLTPWEAREYSAGVWHTVGSATICGLFLIGFLSLL